MQVRTTNYVELIGFDYTDCGTEQRDTGGCVFEQEAKHGQIASQQKFGEELLLLALKRRSPVRVAEDDSPFVPSLSPNQFSLASPK